MRRITYEFLGGVGGVFPRSGTPADLALDIPYLIPPGNLIPPLAVLNDIFRVGRQDAGMSGGCAWEAFEIDETEYDELVAELRRRGDYVGVDTPQWVTRHADWNIWLSERNHGLPSSKHRRLCDRLEKSRRALDAAQATGDPELIAEWHAANIEVGHEWSDFVMGRSRGSSARLMEALQDLERAQDRSTGGQG